MSSSVLILVDFATRYHCLYTENEPENETSREEEDKFESSAVAFQGKYRQLMSKYQLLIMKESMVSHG